MATPLVQSNDDTIRARKRMKGCCVRVYVCASPLSGACAKYEEHNKKGDIEVLLPWVKEKQNLE